MDYYDHASTINPVAFALRNKICNENGSQIEFYDHLFLIEPYADMTREQYVMKPSQIGWSVLGINKSLWLSQYKKANVIYTLPTKSVVKDFVTPKVDPIIRENKVYQSWIGDTDSVALKAVGDRFVYFRGSFEESAAISISAHVLINDEVDRSNQTVLNTYRSRLDDSLRSRPDLGFVWQFSNPSIPGYGVDEGYQESDQKHWFVKCPHCNYEWYLKWPDNVDLKRGIYICTKCGKEIDNEARRTGRWVRKRNSEISGYWISQLMIPWMPATKIITDSKRNQAVFHNFTLGLPYVSSDTSVTRKTIIGCISPDKNPMTEVCMGIDNGVMKTVVIGNKHGIFKTYETESWKEIEADIVKYNAIFVIDAMPYPTPATKLANKYQGRGYIHYFQEDKKNAGVINWGENDDSIIVKSDRTKVIDMVVDELLNKKILINMTLTELEQFVYDWTQLYRTIEANSQGIQKAVWLTIEERRDHFAFATIYWRIAMEHVSGAQSSVVNTPPPLSSNSNQAIMTGNGKMIPGVTPQDIIRKKSKLKRDWRSV